MRVRLLIIEPEQVTEPPWEPMVVTENEEGVSVGNYGHAVLIASASLETVTMEQIRCGLRLRADEQPFLYLSPIRSLPEEHWATAEWSEWLPRWLQWLRHWWMDEVADLVQQGCIETSPALLVAA
jgi:hypothetical protein